MKCLITGGCGFLGSNLAAAAMQKNWEVILFDNLSRKGSAENLAWLKTQGQFTFIQGDIRTDDIQNVIQHYQPNTIFHLAGQVAMTTSIDNPKLDFEINTMGTINLLEAIRAHCPQACVIYSSTNKVYGDLDQFPYVEEELRYRSTTHPQGFNESATLSFHSPYGCSKGAADQYMLDYARIYGLNTIVFRHSSIYGARQFSTFDQGWIGWFISQALEARNNPNREPFTISGNGKQVRDVLFSSDIIRCYFKAVQHIDKCRGQAFNIGGGFRNSFSILELLNFLESHLDIKLSYITTPWRQSDQKIFIADITKANTYFDWQPQISKEAGLCKMIEWVIERAE